MSQVSKRQLGKKIETKVFDTFWLAIVKFNKKDESALFFSELFTFNERVNFAKRLSVAVLLHKGYDWLQIVDLLKVSSVTVAKVAPKIRTKGFKLFFGKLEREENWRKFWEEMASTYRIVTHGDKVARFGK